MARGVRKQVHIEFDMYSQQRFKQRIYETAFKLATPTRRHIDQDERVPRREVFADITDPREESLTPEGPSYRNESPERWRKEEERSATRLIVSNLRGKVVPNMSLVELVRDEQGDVVAHHELDFVRQAGWGTISSVHLPLC